MKKLKWPTILMIVAILAVAGFQGYWLKNNYDREKQTLEIKTNSSFRQTILRLQASKLRLERFNVKLDSSNLSGTASVKRNGKRPPARPKEQPISIVNLIQEKMLDSLRAFDTSGKAMPVIAMKSAYHNLFVDSMGEMRGVKTIISMADKMDSVLLDPDMIRKVSVTNGKTSPEKVITINYSSRPAPDQKTDSFRVHGHGNMFIDPRPAEADAERRPFPGNNTIFRFLNDVDSLSLQDSVTVQEIASAYTTRLKDDRIGVGFKVARLDSADVSSPNTVTIGFSHPASFSLSLQNTFGYMLDKLKLPILFSVLLIGITVFSFVLLYRNMIKQQRLAALKNEFISNITHELKTPIATVGVAIEALKSFNAMHDPQRTREYLDISQNELQRLNLLVDKVLKLSMFEKKEIELKYETLNLKELLDEVLASLRLQIEKYRATVTVNCEGDCILQADRLHLMSVIFNLLDNALKYSKGDPAIRVDLEELEGSIRMKVADNGIGIAPEYQAKIFDKFFRVPHGDTHNAKGYGLGLSYAAHVIKKHKGTIDVESKEGEGTTFIISLPKQTAV